MNRPIKFRAWDNNKREYYFSPELNDHDGAKRWFAMTEDMDYEAGFAPLEQFTDILDKNGKEIWEGDVNADDDNQRSEVVFYAGGFYLKYGPTKYTHIGANAPFNLNVIGNIHENPELL